MSRTDRITRVAAAVVIAAALCSTLASCGFVAASKKSDTKPGAFVVIGRAEVPVTSGASAVGAACTAPTGFTDVADLTRVTVTDSAGKTVATGTLGTGVAATGTSGIMCEFPFIIRGVPDGSTTYSIAIGNRPSQTFQAADLRTNTQAIITFGT